MLVLAICDDVREEREILQDYIKTYCTQKNAVVSITEFCSANELLECDALDGFDAIFMDIYMEGTDGMTCAKKLRGMGYHGCFVFFTSSTEYAVDGFIVEALDYLVKPVSYERFYETMNRLLRHCEDALASIDVMINGQKETVYLRDLYYVETGANHNTILHLSDGMMNSTTLISDIESSLSGYPNFLRCHRSFLINMSYVERVEETIITMQDGSQVLLPVRRAPLIKRQIMNFLRMRMQEELS